jgi:hypothetical protein
VSETTDVILAAGPIVVAIVAIGAAAWQQKRGFAHARTMADLDDVRALFDQAAVTLAQASRALSGLESGLFTHGSRLVERAPSAWTDARESAEKVRATRERLSVRLDPHHGVIAAFTAADEAAWAAVNGVAAMSPTPESHTKEAWDAVRGGHERLIAAKADFMRAAAETVGVRLPRPRTAPQG